MRQLGWVAGGLVVGFVLGGVAPRQELAGQRIELARLEGQLAQVARRERARPGPLDALAGLGGGPVGAPPPASDRAAGDGDGDGDGDGENGDLDGAAVAEVGSGPGAAPSPAELRTQLDAAVEAQALRAAQSRAALADQAGLDAAALDEVDAIAARTSAALATHAEELLALGVLDGEEPEPADLLGLTHEVTGVLYEGQEALDAVLGDSRDGVDRESRTVFNLLDLGPLRDAMLAGAELAAPE